MLKIVTIPMTTTHNSMAHQMRRHDKVAQARFALYRDKLNERIEQSHEELDIALSLGYAIAHTETVESSKGSTLYIYLHKSPTRPVKYGIKDLTPGSFDFIPIDGNTSHYDLERVLSTAKSYANETRKPLMIQTDEQYSQEVKLVEPALPPAEFLRYDYDDETQVFEVHLMTRVDGLTRYQYDLNGKVVLSQAIAALNGYEIILSEREIAVADNHFTLVHYRIGQDDEQE